MDIAILHTDVSANDSIEDQDTLTQVRAVSESLGRLGHRPTVIPCTLNLALAREKLLAAEPRLVFNLVESLGGTDSLIYLATALLDALGLPYTGNPTDAIFPTTHKVLAKRILRLAGMPTPDWLECDRDLVAGTSPLQPPCIVKAIWEHGSRELDDGNVVGHGDTRLVRQRVADFTARTGRPCFAEQFIDGREFNLAMIEGSQGPQVLPPGEIQFLDFPPDKPRIVNHRAKWHEGSFEYDNTPRHFDFPAEDRPLLDRLTGLALDAWRLFGLRGYARIDFRVNGAGQPWILEVNANPCLSPEAGYAAALEEAGIGYDEAIAMIVRTGECGVVHGESANRRTIFSTPQHAYPKP